MDRNNIIGFSLIAILVVLLLFNNQREQKLYNEQKRSDSLAFAKTHPNQVIDSIKTTQTSTNVAIDTLSESAKSSLPVSYYGKSDTIALENKKIS